MSCSFLDFPRTAPLVRWPITKYWKVCQFVSALIRNRPAFMNLKQSGLYLDVGCGPNTNPKNINLDYYWCPGIDVCCDITKGLPFPSNYVQGIYTEHCLEHLAFRDVLFVLREFHRVLVPGGHVRIVVPDLEIYTERYSTGQKMPYADADSVDGLYTPAMSLNRIFHAHYTNAHAFSEHQFIYDAETLSLMLARSGFIDIGKENFSQSNDANLLLDTPSRVVESLYMEARKSN